MAANGHGQAPVFELLSQAARQKVRARVADADGNIGAVEQEIRAQLEQLDGEQMPASGGDRVKHQAARAFFVAQLTYLKLLAERDEEQEQPPEPRGFGSVWSRFTGRRAAK